MGSGPGQRSLCAAPCRLVRRGGSVGHRGRPTRVSGGRAGLCGRGGGVGGSGLHIRTPPGGAQGRPGRPTLCDAVRRSVGEAGVRGAGLVVRRIVRVGHRGAWSRLFVGRGVALAGLERGLGGPLIRAFAASTRSDALLAGVSAFAAAPAPCRAPTPALRGAEAEGTSLPTPRGGVVARPVFPASVRGAALPPQAGSAEASLGCPSTGAVGRQSPSDWCAASWLSMFGRGAALISSMPQRVAGAARQ
jgi:hypothetical protein